MRPTLVDGFVLIYNYAVILSGGYAILLFDLGRGPFLVLALVFAIFWTGYFRYRMISHVSEYVDAETI